MTISVSEFKTIYPNFASVDDAILQFHLDCIVETTSEDVFGNCYKNAVYSLLAHEYTLYERGSGASGPVTAESVGSLSRSYGMVGSQANTELALTNYGLQYKRLLRIYASGGKNIC